MKWFENCSGGAFLIFHTNVDVHNLSIYQTAIINYDMKIVLFSREWYKKECLLRKYFIPLWIHIQIQFPIKKTPRGTLETKFER